MESDEEKILSIRVNYQDAINGIAKYNQAIQELKQKESDLKKQFKEGSITQEEYSKEMAATKAVISEYKDNVRILEKEVQNNIKIENEQEKSLNGLRAELSNATRAFDSLSEAERNGAKGAQLRNHINEITNELKKSEEATQRYYRNVGNYENSIKSALGSESKWFQSLQTISGIMSGGVSNAFNMAGKAASSFGKQLLVLLANPIVAIIAGIAGAIMLLVAAFKKGVDSSAANSAKLKEALAPLKVMMEAITNVLIWMVGKILAVVESGEKLLGWVMRMAEHLPVLGSAIKSVNDKMKESIEYQKLANQYARESREEIVKSAERERQVAELRDRVAQKDKYNTQERRKYLQQAINIERQQAAEKKRLALENLRMAEHEIATGHQQREMLDKLAEARANVIRADTDFYNATRRMQTQLANFDTETASDAKQRQQEASERAKEAADKAKENAQKRLEAIKDAKQKEKEAVRAAEDAILNVFADSEAVQREKLRVSYDRQIEDLKDKLANEKNLTKKARSAMNEEILALERAKEIVLQKFEDDSLSKRIDAEQKKIDLLLQTVKKGSDEEYQLKYQQLIKQQEAELHAADIETATFEDKEAKKVAIKKKYGLLMDALSDEQDSNRITKIQEAIKAEYELKISEVGADEEAVLKLKVDEAQKVIDTLEQMQGESNEAFRQRELDAKNSLIAAKKALDDKEVSIEKAKYDALSNVMGGLASITDALGEHNKAFAKLSKVLALAQIAINTGEAIAAGVKQAQAVPYPGNIVAIATTVAAVLGNIAAAIKTVNSAKFATGGLVTGPGSSTSDSISAQLSDGESVMTASATSMFAPALSIFNQIGGGVPIQVNNSGPNVGMEWIKQAIKEANLESPSPVVSVEEYTQVSNRVKYIERLGEI